MNNIKMWLLENVLNDNKSLKFQWFMHDCKLLRKNDLMYSKINGSVGRTIQEKIWLILHDIKNIPLCAHCAHNLCKFINFKLRIKQMLLSKMLK